jgi:photosystem II stability/assembly factor-like uncharacterized protein
MADWDGLRRDLEDRLDDPPPFQALRDRRRRRQQRRAVAATFTLVLVGTASGVAILGRSAQRNGGSTVAGGTAADRFVLGDKLPAKYVYADYVVTDVDFVSPDIGWAIGLRCADEQCDVRTWRTDDGGRSWAAPVTVATDLPRTSYTEQDPSGGGVRSLRMVDANEGFAFNPDLYVTHDGARTWTRVPQPSKVASVSVLATSVWVFERGCTADDDCDAVLRTGTLGKDFALHDATIPATEGIPTAVRRSDPLHGYLLSYDAPNAPFRRTADGGRTWDKATNPCPTAVGANLSAGRARPLLLVCTTAVDETRKTATKKAFTSTDAGTTWRALADLPPAGTLTDLVAVSATTAYATTQDPARLLVTTDGGATWQVAPGSTTRAYGYGNLDVVDPGHVWAMGDAGVLWRIAGGTTWSRVALPPGGPRATGTPKAIAAVDADVEFSGLSFLDVDRGWAVGQRCVKETCRAVLRRTDDGGETWRPVNAPTGAWTNGAVPGVAFADERNGWVYGPALFSTHDGGKSWRRLTPGGRLAVVTGDVVWVVGADGQVRRGPVARDHLDVVLAKSAAHASFTAADPLHAYVVAGTVTATADGGRTWVSRPAPCTEPIVRVADARAANDLWVVCGAEGGGGHQPHTVARSSDGGRHWATVRGDQEGYVFALAAVSGSVAWRADDGMAAGLRTTSDGGRTWRLAVPEPTGGGVRSLVAVDATHGFALLWEGRVYRTTDGSTWEPLSRP